MRACKCTRACSRESLRVRCTCGDQSVDTHLGSKPGRADRSGQSASALSLFKVRLTLSTIPKKKSRPGPPILPATSCLSFFLFLSIFILVNRLLCLSSKLEVSSIFKNTPLVRWSRSCYACQLFHIRIPKVISMDRDSEFFISFPYFLEYDMRC